MDWNLCIICGEGGGGSLRCPWTKQQLQNCNRIDIVWDRYVKHSLKDATREKRGKGVRRKVRGQTKLPTNFPDFLRDPSNKTELFEFLSKAVANYEYPIGKEVYITSGNSYKLRIVHFLNLLSSYRGICHLQRK